MIPIPLARRTSDGVTNGGRLINMYAEVNDDATSEFSLLHTPGFSTYHSISLATLGKILRILAVRDRIYVVGENRVIHINSAGAEHDIGAITYSDGDRVLLISDDDNIILLGIGNLLYRINYDDNAISTLADKSDATDTSAYAVSNSVEYLDGRFVFSEQDSARWFISGLRDSTFDATEFAYAEGGSGNIQRIVRFNRNLYIFKENNTEAYYNSGGRNYPFSRVSGVFIEKGLLSVGSAIIAGTSLMWQGHDGVIYQMDGFTPVRVSTHDIEHILGLANDCTAYSYIEGGHTFYVIDSQSAERTVAYDLTTGLWHERTLSTDDDTSNQGRTNVIEYDNKVITHDGDSTLIQTSIDHYTNVGALILRTVVLPPIQTHFRDVVFYAFQLDFGALDIEDYSQRPTVRIDYSEDFGKTFKNVRITEIGRVGDYHRVRLTRLGRSKTRNFRVRILAPIPFKIVNAYVEANATSSGLH